MTFRVKRHLHKTCYICFTSSSKSDLNNMVYIGRQYLMLLTRQQKDTVDTSLPYKLSKTDLSLLTYKTW